jgi:threonyl-tRNA synthetase
MENNKEKLQILRHSAAHLAAHAVLELFPDTILTIGPATEEGFFYDMLPKHNFKEEDLALIEARMHELSKKNFPITHTEISKEEARKIFANNPFKLELIESIPGTTVGLSQQGNFYDLCRGGHVASTGEIKYFKLLNISGSYWRADRNNQALQRITGTAFLTAQDFADYERRKEEAALYDHRKLGKQLDLFSFHEEGVGFPFFHPKGKRIINTLIAYLRKILEKAGYEEISTPILLTDTLWQQSGHYAHYKENMYFCLIDDKSYAIKPMNCPGAILVYKERPRSYRDLPLKLAEFGLVHRHELSGVLQGLFRVRAFSQDDAHIFCTVSQLHQEIKIMIDMFFAVYKKFGFEHIDVALSTQPKNYIGSDELWQEATQALRDSLDATKIPYKINEGDGAFYGPKIDFRIKDSMGREWQCGTIQVDFFQPEKFNLSYISPQGVKERPVMIHRAIYGSLERFFGILIEHYKGHFPFWLAPVQIRILTITDEQKDYARELLKKLKEHGFRAELDESSDQISAQIKNAQVEKIPWMLVIGKKEVENKTITLRYNDGKQEFGITFDELLNKAAHHYSQ